MRRAELFEVLGVLTSGTALQELLSFPVGSRVTRNILIPGYLLCLALTAPSLISVGQQVKAAPSAETFRLQALSLDGNTVVIAPEELGPTTESYMRPNIVFMLSDDQSWDGLSATMHPEFSGSRSRLAQTPNLEKLSREGMRFSAAYSPAPVCSPTRIGLLTGRSPAALHWTKAARSVSAADGYKLIPPVSIRQIPTAETTFAELLKSAGYTTAHYGKWHLNGGGPGAHGFDEHDGNLGNEHAAKFSDPNPVDIFGMT